VKQKGHNLIVFPGRDANFIFSKLQPLMYPIKLWDMRWLRISIPCSICKIARPERSFFKHPCRSTPSQNPRFRLG